MNLHLYKDKTSSFIFCSSLWRVQLLLSNPDSHIDTPTSLQFLPPTPENSLALRLLCSVVMVALMSKRLEPRLYQESENVWSVQNLKSSVLQHQKGEMRGPSVTWGL